MLTGWCWPNVHGCRLVKAAFHRCLNTDAKVILHDLYIENLQ